MGHGRNHKNGIAPTYVQQSMGTNHVVQRAQQAEDDRTKTGIENAPSVRPSFQNAGFGEIDMTPDAPVVILPARKMGALGILPPVHIISTCG